MVQTAEDFVRTNLTAERRLSALHPPAHFREIHTVRLEYFRTMASANSGWKQALLHGDASARDSAVRRIGTEGMVAIKRVADAMKHTGAIASLLRDSSDTRR